MDGPRKSYKARCYSDRTNDKAGSRAAEGQAFTFSTNRKHLLWDGHTNLHGAYCVVVCESVLVYPQATQPLCGGACDNHVIRRRSRTSVGYSQGTQSALCIWFYPVGNPR